MARVAILEAELGEKRRALEETVAGWNRDMARLQRSQEREMEEIQKRTVLQQQLEHRDRAERVSQAEALARERALSEALARERALLAKVALLEADGGLER